MTAIGKSIIISPPRGKQNKKPERHKAMKIPNTINELVKLHIVTRVAERAEKILPMVDSCHHKGKVLFLSPEFATACYPGLCLHSKPQAGDIIIRYSYRHSESIREYHIRTIINALTRRHTVRTIGWVDGERRYWFGRSVWTACESQAVVDTDGGIWILGGNAGAGLICHHHITSAGTGLRADFITVAGDRRIPKHAPAWLSHWDGRRVAGWMGCLYIKTSTDIFKNNAINNIWRVVKKSGIKLRLADVRVAFNAALRGVIAVPNQRINSCGHHARQAFASVTSDQINAVAAMLSTLRGIAYMRAAARGDNPVFASHA